MKKKKIGRLRRARIREQAWHAQVNRLYQRLQRELGPRTMEQEAMLNAAMAKIAVEYEEWARAHPAP